MRTLVIFLSIGLAAAGCSLPVDSLTGRGGGGGKADELGDAGPDGGVPYQTLVAGEWTMPAGEEGYRCVFKTIEKTTYVRAFRPIAPLGTHHTVLTVGAADHPDGVFPCQAAMNYPV